MEVETRVGITCPCCGHTFYETVTVDVEPSELARDTLGD